MNHSWLLQASLYLGDKKKKDREDVSVDKNGVTKRENRREGLMRKNTLEASICCCCCMPLGHVSVECLQALSCWVPPRKEGAFRGSISNRMQLGGESVLYETYRNCLFFPPKQE